MSKKAHCQIRAATAFFLGNMILRRIQTVIWDYEMSESYGPGITKSLICEGHGEFGNRIITSTAIPSSGPNTNCHACGGKPATYRLTVLYIIHISPIDCHFNLPQLQTSLHRTLPHVLLTQLVVLT